MPGTPMDCERFTRHLHARRELDPPSRAASEAHEASCPSCRVRALEADRLGDLLLGWEAPPPRTALTEQTLARLRGDGPSIPCHAATADLDEWIAGDLAPWRTETLRQHLEQCPTCHEEHADAEALRQLWLDWPVPAPSGSVADAVVRRLESPVGPEPAAAPISRLPHWLRGDVRIPRSVAALTFAAVTIAFGSLWRASTTTDAGPRPSDSLAQPANGDGSEGDLVATSTPSGTESTRSETTAPSTAETPDRRAPVHPVRSSLASTRGGSGRFDPARRFYASHRKVASSAPRGAFQVLGDGR